MNKILINDVTIRDIFQNLDPDYIDSRVLDPILYNLDRLNLESLEIWGGSSFEKMLESGFEKSPWEILSYIKEKIPSTPLQVLIGAKNLVGLEIFSRNIIEKFIKCSIDNGIEIFRVYDSLNDFENLKQTILVIKKNNAKCQGTIIYNSSKEVDFYADLAVKLESLGCDSICIKDVESTLVPGKVRGLFKNLSQNLNNPVFLSVYNLRGLQTINYFEACESGCNGIDFSFMPPFYALDANVFALFLSLKDTKFSLGINFHEAQKLYNYIKKNIYPYIDKKTYTKIPINNIEKSLLPKWLLSSITRQLGEIGESEKLDEVLDEIFKIKKEVGNPTLSSPVGQIIGSQAILNTIISDYRWEIICDEMKKLLCGYYGKLPDTVDKSLTDRISDYTEPLLIKNGQDIEDIYNQCKLELKNLSEKEEDILCYCFFPEKAKKFLEKKLSIEKKNLADVDINLDSKLSEREKLLTKISYPDKLTSKTEKDKIYSELEKLDVKKIKEIANLIETTNIDEIKLELEGIKISINKSGLKQNISEYADKSKVSGDIKHKTNDLELSSKDLASENIVEVKSPIVGTFYNSPESGSPPFVSEGDKVKKGDTLCIVEAMKLMNKITSDYNGIIKEILLKNEDPVEFNQTIMLLETEKA